MSENDKHEIELLKAGKTLAISGVGAAVGVAIGSFIGPEGALLGGFLGGIGSKSIELLGDISSRSLSNKEKARIGGAAAFALEKIKSKMDQNLIPRSDWKDSNEGQKSASELFEGVLQKSKNDHEEKKLPFIANIFANTIFLPDVTFNEANHYLKVASNISYSQMCLLSVFSNNYQGNKFGLKTNDYENSDFNSKTSSLLQEAFELINLGLIAIKEPGEHSYTAILDGEGLKPAFVTLTDFGRCFFQILELDQLPQDELSESIETLK